VGTALVPLINALSAPKKPAAPPAAPYPYPAPTQQWPTYADGLTPLPVMPDRTPDWNAYYSGFPSPGATAVPSGAPHAQAPQQYGQQGHAPQSQAPQGHPPQTHPPQGYGPQGGAQAPGQYPPPPPLPPRPPQP
jgi:hypothetical protein